MNKKFYAYTAVAIIAGIGLFFYIKKSFMTILKSCTGFFSVCLFFCATTTFLKRKITFDMDFLPWISRTISTKISIWSPIRRYEPNQHFDFIQYSSKFTSTVKEYSTWGGTSAKTFLWISLSCSNWRSCLVNTVR